MLKLEIGHETFDETTNEFGFAVEFVLELEHSLAVLSKWESMWEKPFIDDREKSPEEILSYIECMIQNSTYPKDILQRLTKEDFDKVNDYLNAKQTATWFSDRVASQQPARREKITNELIYYWISGIPSPPPGYENWHLSRLFTYIKIHDVKNQKPQKSNTPEARAAARDMNRQRRAAAAAQHQG